MKLRKCPQAKGKMCWDYGDCESCSFGKMILRYERKITRLKAENAKLVNEADTNAALAMGQKLRTDKLDEAVEAARKETAKEIIGELKGDMAIAEFTFDTQLKIELRTIILRLEKEYGVEVKE